MIIIVHVGTTEQTIESQLGCSEYSYYFVLAAFRPVLERIGHVIEVREPAREVDPIYALSRRYGDDCVFLSFAPPHLTVTGLECPTIPVFAWEFDSIPSEVWDGEWRNDWRRVLRALGRAVTHSGFTVAATRRALGPQFDVRSIPAPVWDRFASLYGDNDRRRIAGTTLAVTGRVIDTRSTDLAPYRSTVRRALGHQPLPGRAGDRENRSKIVLSGIVYTAVFNPMDGRKNWYDMIAGFVWAFRDEGDATLVLKLTHHDCAEGLSAILEDLAKLAPFRCRIVLIDGFLADAEYEALTRATRYTVNTSHGEGQCLPLMEFMSAGIPAISPTHSSMADYVDARNAFVVRSTPEASYWQHDPRRAIRTRRHRIDWGSLVEAFREAQRVATGDPGRYRAMSQEAHLRLAAHCSQEEVEKRLRSLLGVAKVGDGEEPGRLRPMRGATVAFGPAS